MAQLIACYEDLIYGEDGHAPIRKILDDALHRAKEDKNRLRLEIRVQPIGVPNTRQEAVFFADPHETTSDNLMRVLTDRLEDSPGPEFHGRIRINFNPAGHSGEKYGSWSRSIRYNAGNIAQPVGLRSVLFDGDGDDDPNNAQYLSQFQDPNAPNPTQAMPVDHRAMQQWLETAMGFTFRSMAQQMTMFERATRMMEAYTLRFGFPHPQAHGITEMANVGSSQNTNSGGLGLLPMLMNAAAHLANADNPTEMAARVGSMATGNAPPSGAARHAAVQGAGRMIGQLTRPNAPAHPAPGHAPPPAMPHPHDPMDDIDFQGGFDEDTSANHVHDESYEGEEEHYENFEDADDPHAAISELSAAQMKEAVIAWIRSNPEQNKSAVMDMLPDLTKEVM